MTSGLSQGYDLIDEPSRYHSLDLNFSDEVVPIEDFPTVGLLMIWMDLSMLTPQWNDEVRGRVRMWATPIENTAFHIHSILYEYLVSFLTVMISVLLLIPFSY
jgi:hypothetical protein